MSRRLDELCRIGELAPAPVQLGPRDQTFRRLFWTRGFERWCLKIIADEITTRSIAGVDEQINKAFADFVTGRPMTGMTKVDPPRGQGLWKFKTPDLRLYGWADDINCMIFAAGEYKRVLAAPGPPKDKHLGTEVVKIRKAHSFNEWKYGEIYDVFPSAPRR